MISVLLNVYACNPFWGSEPGMGWNWMVNIAQHSRVFVITEGEWETEIEQELSKLPQKDNIHFYYLPVSDKVRKICWNQGDWRFYYYYRKWQIRALNKAKQIIAEKQIDIIHQLNMIGFREPGFLWKIDDIPYVWGPIGGMNLYPERYMSNLTSKEYLLVMLKNIINRFQMRYSIRVRKAIKRADVLIAATPESQKYIDLIYNKESFLLSETGCYSNEVRDIDSLRFKNTDSFDVLWVGRFFYAKQLSIALHAIAKVKSLPNLKFHIVGEGSDIQVSYYKGLAKELNIEHICLWHGKVENKKVHELMSKSQLFFFTSVSEATSTVVLEALANNLPVLCFNTCGFGAVIDELVGTKIELSTPEQSAIDFSEKIEELYLNRQLLIDKSINTLTRTEELSWNAKIKKMIDIYKSLVSRNEAYC